MRFRPFLLIALVFLFGPLALLVGGARPDVFENRAPAPRPSLSQGWGAIDDATRYLAEHLPLREEAVKANTRLSQDVFAYTPIYGDAQGDQALPFAAPGSGSGSGPGGSGAASPPGMSAVLGKDDWLFLQQDFDYACEPPVRAAVAVARWQRFARAVTGSGRSVSIVVGPDKSELYADQLPDGHPKLACRAEGSKELWDAIRAGGAAFTPNLLDVLRAARTGGGPQPVYFRRDTHWNGVGALAAVKAILARLSPEVRIRDSDTTPIPKQEYTGDLNKMLGAPDDDVSPGVTLVRPGAGRDAAAIVRVAGVDTQVDRRVGATAPMVEGRTLFIHDSFGWALQPLLSPYLRHLSSATFLVEPAALAKLIARSDHVIIETGQREFINRSSLYEGLTAAAIERAGPARR